MELTHRLAPGTPVWTLASAAGGAVVALAARLVSIAMGGAAGQAMGGIVAEAETGALALGGMMLGVAIPQWIVVRRRISWGGWLALATVAGGAAGGAVILGAWPALSGIAGQIAGVVAGFIAGLSVPVLVQWLVLRRQFPRALWWSAASAGGLIGAWFCVVMAGTLTGGESDALLGAAFWSGCGAITGVALVRLLRHDSVGQQQRAHRMPRVT